MRPVKITETVLRDSHQSLIATRMTTEEMLPIIEKMDGIGYHSLFNDSALEHFSWYRIKSDVALHLRLNTRNLHLRHAYAYFYLVDGEDGENGFRGEHCFVAFVVFE